MPLAKPLLWSILLIAPLSATPARAENVACTINCTQNWQSCTVFAIGTGYRECAERQDACMAECKRKYGLLYSPRLQVEKAAVSGRLRLNREAM